MKIKVENGMETSFIDEEGYVIRVGDVLVVRADNSLFKEITGVVVWDKDCISLKITQSDSNEYDADFSIPSLCDFTASSNDIYMVEGIIIKKYSEN